jgi:polar amino acid transport system ATP-binding protein
MGEILLEVNHLKKSFGSNEVLKDISATVREGEVVSILGPSGSGKSTFLRCMTMLESMDAGDLIYEGKYAAKDTSGKAVYAGKEEKKEIARSFGLVFQNFNLFPHYSVLKNIMISPLLTQKRKEDEVEKEARELLEKVGLADKADAYPGQLSGGQQQRVAIARALAMKPKILFFDEPTSALDPETTAEVLKLLRQLAQEKMTMVIVTHEISFARGVSNRVIFMDGGNIIEEGSPEEVIDHPSNERTRSFLKKLDA